MSYPVFYFPGGVPTGFCEICDGWAIQSVNNSCPIPTVTPSSVMLHSGQFFFRKELLSIGSLGGGWGFALNYLAGSGVDGILGKNFNFPDNLHLEEVAGGGVDLVSGENTRETFLPVAPGVYEPAPNNNTRATLVRRGTDAADEFVQTSSAGVVSTFFGFDPAIATPGRLKSIVDRFGSQQTYQWQRVDSLDELLSVTDSYGRTIHYRYHGSQFGHRLREIEDFLGRKLNFQYDELGHLVAVVTPSILRGTEGNTFPGGTAYVFQYDVNNARPERRDDLVRIWFPNQATSFVDVETRAVDVPAVYQNATPRYVVEYGQDPTDDDLWGRVVRETVGSPSTGVGGTYQYLYFTNPEDLPENIIDPDDPVAFRSVVTDRNGNQTVYDFSAANVPVRSEIVRSRSKIDIPAFADFPGYVTWTRRNIHNQPLLVILPEGNSMEYQYEDGQVAGIGAYPKRIGLLLRETHKVDNPLKNDPVHPIAARRDGPSNGQTQRTWRYFYEPIFNQLCAMIPPRGNPIDAADTYFDPQNGGTAPTDSDRSRYATLTYVDYQKDTAATVTGDFELQDLLGLSANEIQSLIEHVNAQLKATDGSGGIPAGFEINLGDVNGDGTGNGASSALPDARHLGSGVKTKRPPVRLIGIDSITTQMGDEIFTSNSRGQVTTRTDAEGNLTVYVRYPESDPEGDGKFVGPELSNKQYGYVKALHVDADPNDVMSLVGEDGDLVDFIAGKIVREKLDNKIEKDMDATGSTPDRLITRYRHDANQNLIEVIKPEGNKVEYDHDERNLRIGERDGADAVANQPGAVTVTAFGGNGHPLQVIGPGQRGGSGNHQTVILEDAFYSGQPLTHTGDFLVENTYDGFDRVIQTKDAIGNVTVWSHDPDGRVVETKRQGPIGGATPQNRSAAGNVDLAQTIHRFDEAGRQYESQKGIFVANGVTLPSGNRQVTHTGGGLAANSIANDHTDTVVLVDSSGQATGNQTYVLTRTIFDRAGREAVVLQDNTGEATNHYDGASRLIQQSDPLGNFVQYQHDAHSNVTLVNRIEKATITEAAVTDEIFRTAMRYDSLNRLVVRAEQGADGTLSDDLADTQTLFTLTGFDSRGNKTIRIDPKHNSVISVFDGAARGTQVQQHLRIDGLGENPPAPGTTLLPYGGATILTSTFYDANGRPQRLVDDRGGVTDFEYDSLDRETLMRFHDGSTRVSEYDEASDVVRFTDENGSVFDNTFDAGGRKVQCDITLAAGVVGTDQQTFEYDGLSRQTQSLDAVGATEAAMQTFYDALNRVLEESQKYGGHTRTVTNTAFASEPIAQLTFPDGRQIDNSYDLIYRRTDVAEAGGSSIAAWQFFGPSRVAEVTLGNGLICTQMNNARTRSAVQQGQTTPAWGDDSSDRLGYDGAGRMITKRYLAGGIDSQTHGYDDTSCVVGFTTAWDRASNKFYERHLHAESRSHLYEPTANGVFQGGYDSLNRLRQYRRGELAEGGGSITTPISLPNTDQWRTYDLDGLGNWRRTGFERVSGSETTEIRRHNPLNQITRRDGTPFSYDLNGNLTDDGLRLYTWDALNRLKEVKRKSDNETIGNYAYDAAGRRIRKIVSNGGLSANIPNGTTDYLYSVWQCIEERDGSNAPTKQYVWGIYIDELLQQRNLVTINDLPAGDYYPLADLLYRTTALTDANGDIVEAYDTDAYGNTLIFTGPDITDNWWAEDAVRSDAPACDYIYTGRRYDSHTTLYYYRARYYDPVAGRFLSRDRLPNESEHAWASSPIGHAVLYSERDWPSETGTPYDRASWYDSALGRLVGRDSVLYDRSKWNLYQYVAGNPLTKADPTGLICVELHGPSAPTWNTPAGPACNAYACSWCPPYQLICNSAGSGCWANCVRGCLLADWNAVACSYNSGSATRHAVCFNYCDFRCHGGVVVCSGPCPCPPVPAP